MFWHMAEFSDLWMFFGLCVFSLAWGGVGSESQPCVGDGWVATASRARGGVRDGREGMAWGGVGSDSQPCVERGMGGDCQPRVG